jgi:hypothetical protein
MYMSDHGKPRSVFGRFHTILIVQGEGIAPYAERRIFSYLDFGKLLDWILLPSEAKYKGLFRDKAEIQDLDFYSGYHLKKIIQLKHFLDKFTGYQGIVTEEDIYIRHNNGLELFCKHKNDGVLFAPERLEYLRGITGTKKLDVWTEEKLQFSKYTYMVLDKYHQRNHEYEEKKSAVLKNLIGENDCSREVVLALYPGGMATYRLLLRVGFELCANVRYIIDGDAECVAGKLGIEVIDPERLSEYDVDIVVKTSPPPNVAETELLSKQAIKERLSGEKVEVIDIYEYLADNGVPCSTHFWDRELTDEDIDVGFPPV